jgi:hypothetical protein
VAHGALHAVLMGGVVAGVAAALVVVVLRIVLGLALFLAILYQTRSAYITRPLRRALWATVKIAARPLVGDRVFEPGFDLAIVSLGIASLFGVSILMGLLFAALAHGRSRTATIALGVLFGIGAWFLNLRLINPTPTTAIEIIPSGLAMAYAFLWYEGRLSHSA